MLSVAEWRAAVGARAADWTDAQVEAHRDRYFDVARALVRTHLASRRRVDVGLQRVDQPRRPRRPRARVRPAC